MCQQLRSFADDFWVSSDLVSLMILCVNSDLASLMISGLVVT